MNNFLYKQISHMNIFIYEQIQNMNNFQIINKIRNMKKIKFEQKIEILNKKQKTKRKTEEKIEKRRKTGKEKISLTNMGQAQIRQDTWGTRRGAKRAVNGRQIGIPSIATSDEAGVTGCGGCAWNRPGSRRPTQRGWEGENPAVTARV
jgi:hypothetical protein